MVSLLLRNVAHELTPRVLLLCHRIFAQHFAFRISHFARAKPDISHLTRNFARSSRRNIARSSQAKFGARHSPRVSGAADNLILGRQEPVKCPNSAQPVECPVRAKFNEVSGLRHAKVSRNFARAKFRARNFAREISRDLMNSSFLNPEAGATIVGANRWLIAFRISRFAKPDVSHFAFRETGHFAFRISRNRTFRISRFAKPDTLWVLVDQVSDCPRRQTLSESVWRRGRRVVVTPAQRALAWTFAQRLWPKPPALAPSASSEDRA